MLTTTLERVHLVVHAADTADAGVALVERLSPAVTVLDLDLASVDRFAAAQRIRAVSETYLLLLAGRDVEQDLLEGYECGADSVVSKPVRALELRARVEAMLRRPRIPAP